MKKLKTVIAVNIKDCKISKDLENYFSDTLYQIDAYHEEYHPNTFKLSHLRTELKILKNELKQYSDTITETEANFNKQMIKEIQNLISLLKANNVQVVYF